MIATFYILFSRTAHKFYIGHTTQHVEERLRKHNSDHDGFTGKFKDWVIMHTEEFPSKTLAYAREREVKKWKSHARIQALINREITKGLYLNPPLS
jgi:putative endonuclease